MSNYTSDYKQAVFLHTVMPNTVFLVALATVATQYTQPLQKCCMTLFQNHM